MQDHAIQCRTISRNSLRGHMGGGRSAEVFDQAEHNLAVTFVLEEENNVHAKTLFLLWVSSAA